MKFIIFPLLMLIIIAFSVQLINLQPISTDFNDTYDTQTGTKDDISGLGISSVTWNITLMVGFIALFSAIAVIGVFSGLNVSVLGSTVQISERSQKILYNMMFYGGIWGIFSVLATTGINGIGLFSNIWTSLFYLIMTLFYVLGINKQIEGN